MIKIYDSLRGRKIHFKKKKGEKIGIYVCGPTVYERGHLGHGRSAIAFDIIRRFFIFMGYEVKYVFNYTDIDDKMIRRAKEEGISVKDLSKKIIDLYERDYLKLGILPPTHNPHATKYIQEMIDLIRELEKKGHTYTLKDGVYYDITSFENYGKLSHQKMEELNSGVRIEERKDKRNHQDFALWKFKKEGEPSWSSPWGEGRPGWHIECSAMSRTLLGESFDIHGGGLDLKFPHHECEIAQSEGVSGKAHVDYWMHNGYITVNKEKMSKSLKNFFTLEEIFKKYHPRVVRFFLMSSHYRSPIEFNENSLDQARKTLRHMDDFYLRNKNDGRDEDLIKSISKKMSQDFDVPGALYLLFEWMKSSPIKVRGTLNALNEIFNIFPVDFKPSREDLSLVKERERSRIQKNWKRSDEIRNQLMKRGIELEDSVNGTMVKPKL